MHMSLCVIDARRLVCVKCGKAAARHTLARRCRGKAMLGDYVSLWLSYFGITKPRISAVFGRACGCAKRQAALNKLGRKIGIG